MALEDAVNPMQGVSGPGPFAKRTDLQYQSTGYGDGVAMQQQMQGAPLAKAMPTPSATPTEVRQAASQGVGLYDASARPNEPVTHGIDMGAGAGSDALMVNQMQKQDADIVAKYLPSLQSLAAQSDTPQSFRAFVSYLQGTL